jgi:hypothetical protein
VAGPVSKIGWKIVGGGATAAAGAVASKAANHVYRKVRQAEPPENPASPNITWVDAVVWALVSGAAVGLGRLAAERVAAQGWVRATGELPPGMPAVEAAAD